MRFIDNRYSGDTKYFDIRAKQTVKCKCGCSTAMPNNRYITTCRWCGGTVYKNKKVEFIYNLNKQLKKRGK